MLDKRKGYEVSDTKLHDISKDEISRDRVRVLKETFRALESELPDVGLGLSLYGSLSKGRALTAETATSSDIDVILLIDQREAVRFYDQACAGTADTAIARTLAALPPDRDGEALDPGEKYWRMQEPIKEFFRNYFNDHASQPAEINFSFSSVTGDKAFDLVMRMSDDIVNDKNYRLMKNYQWVTWLFLMDVGGGLKPHRIAFLKKLGGLEDRERAQKIWEKIAHAVEVWERGRDGVPDEVARQLPSSRLEDELRKYKIA